MYAIQNCTRYPPAPVNFVNPSKLRLAHGEYLVTCPFDKSHTALNTKFCSHLTKCRRNYKDWRMEKDEPILYVTCRYDPKHKVLPPELELHEYSCQMEYMKGAAHAQVIYNMELKKFTGPWHKWQPEGVVHELLAMLRKDLIPPTAVPEGIILWADPRILYQLDDQMAKGLASSNSEVGKRYWAKKSRVRAVDQIGFPGLENSEEIEERYWNAPGEQPRFDWLEHQIKLAIPMQRIPPGLSKSQRNKWIAVNEIRMKTELGFFVNPDGPTYPLTNEPAKMPNGSQTGFVTYKPTKLTDPFTNELIEVIKLPPIVEEDEGGLDANSDSSIHMKIPNSDQDTSDSQEDYQLPNDVVTKGPTSVTSEGSSSSSEHLTWRNDYEMRYAKAYAAYAGEQNVRARFDLDFSD